jgi:hypothetical protein
MILEQTSDMSQSELLRRNEGAVRVKNKREQLNKWNLGCSGVVAIVAIVFTCCIYLYFKDASYTLKPGDSIVLKVPTSKQKEFSPKLYLSKISGGKLELSGKTSWWERGEGNLVGTNYDVLKQEISETYSSSSNIPTKIIKNDPNNSIYLSKEGVVLQSKESWEFEIPDSKQIKITNISDRDIRFEAQVTGE